MMVKAGIKRVEGAIVGDGRFYRDMREHLTWEYADIGTAYGTGWGGLSFYRNKQDFPVTAGATAGAPVNVKIKYPDTPWMNFTSRAVTGPAGTYSYTKVTLSGCAPSASTVTFWNSGSPAAWKYRSGRWAGWGKIT